MTHTHTSTSRKRGRKSIAERVRGEKGLGSIYYETDKGSEVTGHWVATEPRAGMKPKTFRVKGPKWDEALRDRAIDKREQFRLDVATGKVGVLAGMRSNVKVEDQTVNDYVAFWMLTESQPVYEIQHGVEVRIGGNEDTTHANYVTLVAKYITPYFRYILLKDADGVHMEEWMDTLIRLKAPPSQRSNARKLLSQIFNHALKRRRVTGVTENPVLHIAGKAGYRRRKQHASKVEDIMALMRQTRGHERLGALVPMAVLLGLRRQELLALKWQAIDLVNQTVTIGLKGNRIKGRLVERTGVKMRRDDSDVLFMPDLLRDILIEHRANVLAYKVRMGSKWKGPQNPVEGEAYVFPNPHSRTRRCGLMCSPEHLNEWYASECARVGLENTGLHQLRRNCASFLRRLGVSMVEIKDILRHASLSTTELYALSDEGVGRAAIGRLGDSLAAEYYKEAV